MELGRLRRRLPVVAFVLLALVCLILLGFACACLSDQPMQTHDRAAAAFGQMAGIIELWPYVIVLGGLGALSIWRLLRARPRERASPALLQRFLF